MASASGAATYPHQVRTPEEVPAAVERLREAFWAGTTRPASFRRGQLSRLLALFLENKDALVSAVQHDLGKVLPFEALITEYNMVVHEIKEALSNLDHWMAPTDVSTPISCQPASSHIYKSPLGVVLIMSPWNYPINLAIVPLIGAIAAGNTVFLKLSPYSAETANTLFSLLPQYLDHNTFAVESEGGRVIIQALLQQKWDHIFFTGSSSVGKVVYEAAARNLTPVTLELGGKNPCLVDSTIDLDFAAKRICWGKFFNNGQTCLGVDYILVEDGVHDRLVAALTRTIREFYGEDPKQSASYGRVISTAAATRLARLFEQGRVVTGGEADVANKYIAPTVICDPVADSELMNDEIFGPILPIVRVPSIATAIRSLQNKPTPLALYLFSSHKPTQELVLERTRSGACLINEVLVHFTNAELPFGGCGESGLGAYHGDRTFEVFTHSRAVMRSTDKKWLDIPLRYPPYTKGAAWIIDQITSRGL